MGIHTHTYPYIPIHTHTYLYIPIHTHTYPYIPIHTHTYPYIPIHTYTHPFIPIHTYIHTIDHVTPQYVATNLEFFVKNTLYGNSSKTPIFQQISIFLKILKARTHIYI